MGHLSTEQRYTIAAMKKSGHSQQAMAYVDQGIMNSFSPCQIAGRAKVDGIACVSHQRIYEHIYDEKKKGGSLYEFLRRKGKDADALAKVAIDALADWKGMIHTNTYYNGKEFAKHHAIADALGASFFFADPYKSWQRGANENFNGVVRQYIPKKTDFDTVTDQFIAQIEKDLNNRPIKRLGFN